MGIWNRISLACILSGVLLSAAPATGGLFHHPTSQAVLSAKIARARNPIKKAELQMKLARLILDRGIEAYDQNNFTAGKALLERYLKEAQASWATLKGSGRNAVRQPEGFKQLDMAFNGNDRRLADLRRRIVYPENGVVKAVQEASRSVHAQVLDALFPGLRMQRRQRPGAPPAHRAGNSAGANR
jgi:hypothetical protein